MPFLLWYTHALARHRLEKYAQKDDLPQAMALLSTLSWTPPEQEYWQKYAIEKATGYQFFTLRALATLEKLSPTCKAQIQASALATVQQRAERVSCQGFDPMRLRRRPDDIYWDMYAYSAVTETQRLDLVAHVSIW